MVFHSCIEEEKGAFTFDDVVDGICKKLVVRHPHVFGEITVDGTGQVLQNWDAIKRQTKGGKTQAELLGAVPRSLPALMRAAKVQNRAKRVGFDWPDVSGAMGALENETVEFQEALASENRTAIEEELGDLLFSAVNVSPFPATSMLNRRLPVRPTSLSADLPGWRNWRKTGISTWPPPLLRSWTPCGTRQNDWIRARNQPRWDRKSNGGFIMNKVELIAAVTEKTGMSKKDAEKAVSAVLESVVEAVSAGDKVQLVGFGTFEVRNREARTGRNPRTKEAIVIPASKQPVFKAGKSFKDAVAK